MAEAVVDLGAVAHNTALLARAAAPGGLMAIVKADGFGHGMAEVARTALAHGAGWLGVTSVAEALALRREGIDAPVLMWMFWPGEDLEPVLRARVDVSVGSAVHLEAVVRAARRTGERAQVHLKVDTGLSRGGVPVQEWRDLLARVHRLSVCGVLRVRGVWSHFANAERAGAPSVAAQVQGFEDALDAARRAGVRPPLRHLANSAAIMQLPQAGYDLGRAGVALYGVEPVPGRSFGFRPAMTLQARVILTKRVPAGTAVSYGHEWVAPRSTTLALVPLGFADGVPRRAGPQASVLIGGRRAPVAGRISMDQLVVDVGDLPVAVGDVATVFGPGTAGEPTVDDWARWADTNPHEVLTGVGARVPRRYLPVGTPGDDEGGSV